MTVVTVLFNIWLQFSRITMYVISLCGDTFLLQNHHHSLTISYVFIGPKCSMCLICSVLHRVYTNTTPKSIFGFKNGYFHNKIKIFFTYHITFTKGPTKNCNFPNVNYSNHFKMANKIQNFLAKCIVFFF